MDAMKHVSLTLAVGASLLVASLSPAAQAQPPGGPQGRARLTPAQREARMFEMTEKMLGKKLTSAQKQQFRQAFKERESGHRAVEMKFQSRVAKAAGLTPEQFRAKMRQMRPRR